MCLFVIFSSCKVRNPQSAVSTDEDKPEQAATDASSTAIANGSPRGATTEKQLENLGKQSAKARNYLEVLKRYKRNYPSMAEQIEQFVSRVMLAEFFPHLLANKSQAPIWLVGPPGIGKTTMINALANELALSDRTYNYEISEGEGFFPLTPIQDAAQELDTYMTKGGVQAVYIVDEMDRMQSAPVEDRTIPDTVASAASAHLASLGYHAGDFENMIHAYRRVYQGQLDKGKAKKDMLNTLWRIMGTGNINDRVQDTKAIQGVTASIKSALGRIAIAKADVKTLEAVLITYDARQGGNINPEDGARQTIVQRLAHAEQRIREVEIFSSHNNKIPDDIIEKALLFVAKTAVGSEVHIPLDQLATMRLRENPDAFWQDYQNHLKATRFDRVMTFCGGILVFVANDTEYLADVAAKAQNVNSADDVHNAALRLLETDRPRIVSRFLQKVFGEQANMPGFLSRQGDVRHIVPPSTAQWRDIVHSINETFEKGTNTSLRENGINTKVTMGKSMETLLLISGTDSIRGPRTTQAEMDKLYNRYILEVYVELLERSKKAIISSNLPAPAEVTIEAVKNPDGTWVLRALDQGVVMLESALQPTDRLRESAITEGDDLLRIYALRQAGIAFGGTVIFGAPPLSLRLNDGALQDTGELIGWDSSEIDQLDFLRNTAVVLAMGAAAEYLYNDAALSPESERDVSEALRILTLLGDKINTIQKTIGAQHLASVPDFIMIDKPDLFNSLAFKQLLKKDVQQAWLSIFEFAKNLIRQNKNLIEQTSRALLTEPVITGEAYRASFIKYSRALPKSTLQMIERNELGFEPSACMLLGRHVSLLDRGMDLLRGVRYQYRKSQLRMHNAFRSIKVWAIGEGQSK